MNRERFLDFALLEKRLKATDIQPSESKGDVMARLLHLNTCAKGENRR